MNKKQCSEDTAARRPHTKKAVSLLLAMLLTIALSGCASQSAESSGTEPQPSAAQTDTAESAQSIAAPTQSTAEPEKEPVLTEINHCTMRTDAGYFLTEQDRAYTKVLTQAVLNRQEYVSLSSDYDANLRVLMAATDNPYWFFVDEENFSKDHTGLFLTYRYTPAEQAQMQKFMDEEYLTALNSIITPEMNDVDKALAVHHYFGKRIEYDYSWLDAFNMSDEKYLFPDIVIYEALKTGKGVCHTYTYLCEFALRQLGVECLRFTDELNGNEDEGHMWLLVKLEGEYYHMDTTWDSDPYSDKVGLAHFGMTDDERRGEGFDLNLYTFDSSYNGLSCSDPGFQNLRDVLDFEYLGNHRWQLYTSGGAKAVYSSDTRQLT